MTTTFKLTLYWSVLMCEDRKIFVAASPKGLVFVGSPNKSFEELSEWAKKHFPRSYLVKDHEKLEPYVFELTQYLEGKRKTFSVPIVHVGTEFQQAVWHEVRKIPYGQTKSYGDIAKELNHPTAVRAVGAAVGANPTLITVPCHRVVGTNGSLTGYRGGLEVKRFLLDLEQQASSSNG